MALGVVAPFVGMVGGVRAAGSRRTGGVSGSQAQATLTSRQLAGLRVIYSYPGLSVPEALLQRIAAGEAAGVIFFGENVASLDQIAAVTEQLRQAQQQSSVPSPLLLMTDQEGGLLGSLLLSEQG
jgi:beta-N-acetylhexosaminidase